MAHDSVIRSNRRRLIDLTGKRFGSLVVLGRAPGFVGRPIWICRCDCGETKRIIGQSLRDGASRSCGCMLSSEVPLLDRIMSKIGFVPGTSCIGKKGAAPSHLWNIWFESNGRAGKKHNAPRAIWESLFGPIPAGLYVCHTCDNGGCVNPAHLFLGTQKDNIADCVRKGRFMTPARIAAFERRRLARKARTEE